MSDDKETTPASWILQVRSQLERPAPRRLPPSDARQAAVLVPLYVDAGQLWTILTKRTRPAAAATRGRSPFPAASLEDGEDRGTAPLREAQEEIGLEPDKGAALGELDEAEHPERASASCPASARCRIRSRRAQRRRDRRRLRRAAAEPVANPDAGGGPRGADRRRGAGCCASTTSGRRQIWGLTARILQTLLVRLGVEDPLMGS